MCDIFGKAKVLLEGSLVLGDHVRYLPTENTDAAYVELNGGWFAGMRKRRTLERSTTGSVVFGVQRSAPKRVFSSATVTELDSEAMGPPTAGRGSKTVVGRRTKTLAGVGHGMYSPSCMEVNALLSLARFISKPIPCSLNSLCQTQR